MRDWIGNKNSAWATLAASNHSQDERQEDDFYATSPKALEKFLAKIEEDGIILHEPIWECACGAGHLSKTLMEHGYKVISTDLVDRGFGEGGVDFLTSEFVWGGDILTNPPYKFAQEFVEHGLKLCDEGKQIIMFLKIQFLESKSRQRLFKQKHLKYVYVHSERQQCAKNGKFEEYAGGTGTAICYCWFIWEKGYKGEPIIRWIN